MIEELRASIIKKQKAKAKENFFSTKSKLTFWWTVFLISGWGLFYLHLRHSNGRYLSAIQSGLSLLAVVSFCIGAMTIFKLRKAKVDLELTQPSEDRSTGNK